MKNKSLAVFGVLGLIGLLSGSLAFADPSENDLNLRIVRQFTVTQILTSGVSTQSYFISDEQPATVMASCSSRVFGKKSDLILNVSLGSNDTYNYSGSRSFRKVYPTDGACESALAYIQSATESHPAAITISKGEITLGNGQ